MIVDTSAVIAILKADPEASALAAQLSKAKSVSILRIHAVAIVDVTAAQASVARQAHRDFGKGSGHRAQLNFGDCFAYALAAERREPLLFKGDDFAATDLKSAR